MTPTFSAQITNRPITNRKSPSFIHTVIVVLLALLACHSVWADTADKTVIKSPNDNREYLPFTLDNGLSVLVVSDPTSDQAAASLNVQVGSGDDPKQFAGLAHFLEHMLFLGTKKFPKADEYQAFVDGHGGSHNAFTSFDRTNYFFTVDQKHLAPALDRFSQFFIAPLFTPEYVEREKNAVHSEYQARMKDSFRRSFSVFKQVINPEHPLSKFSIGSLETLADKPERTVREALIEFYQDHYSADKMTLVILGKQSTNELKELAVKYFSEVASHPTKPRAAAPELFKAGELPKLIRLKTLKEKHQLSLMFPAPDSKGLYREKPLFFLSSLLGDESQGSLVQVLKDKGWVKNLGAGPGFDYDGGSSMRLSITLTPEGYKHYNDIIALTFDYIELIKKNGVVLERYQQEADLSEISFQFQEKSAPSSYAIGLSGNMAEYPIDQVIYGDYGFSQFDEKLIHQFLDHLTPDNVLITLASLDEPTDAYEPWYQTHYSVGSWSLNKTSHSDQLSQLSQQLALPAANPYVPSDLSVQSAGATEKPRLALVKPGLRVWHQLDADFPAPKSNFYITFRSPLANDTPRHQVATQLYVDLVKKSLNTELYPAQLVGYNVSLYNHARGFSLRLQGYRDKQEKLLESISDTLMNLAIDPQQLAIAKDSLRLAIENKRKDKPYHQAIGQIYQNLLNPRWSDEQKLSAIEWISPDFLTDFAKQLLAAGEMEVLVHGNIAKSEAIALAKPIENNIYNQLHVQSVRTASVNKVSESGETISLSIPHTDNALTFYVQAPDHSIQSHAQYRLLEQILGTPYYTKLRTEEQLGYIVFVSYFPVYNHPGLAFVVQSPVATAEELATRTRQFIQQQQVSIDQLTEKDLQRFKNSLLADLLKREQSLDTRTNRYWQEIDRGYIDFNSREWMAKAIRETTLADIKHALASLHQHQLIVKAEPEDRLSKTNSAN